MEIANLESKLDLRARQATSADAPAIQRLLRQGAHSHLHVDWRLPVDWLGTAGSVVLETTAAHPEGSGVLFACLAVGADPPPAAWVRIFALQSDVEAASLLQGMLELVMPYLRAEGVVELGWLPRDGLPAAWVETAGFELVNQVETMVKDGLGVPQGITASGAVTIRPVQVEDMPKLAEIEVAAFPPLWRHSAAGLRRGWRYARSFHVALLEEEIVGFQYSSESERPQGAHLVRLTVAPERQRHGIGSALMLAALDSYRRQGVRWVSLNTQTDNLASHRLYQKFGFESAGYRLPVWSLQL